MGTALTITAILGLIGAAGGGIFGGINTWKALEEEEEKLRNAQQDIADQEQAALDSLKLKYDIAAEEARKNADKADRQLDLSEDIVSGDFNRAMDALQAQQEGRAREWNNAAMATDQQEGAALAARGASGTRAGSSVDQAIEMQATLNAAQLQEREDAARKGDEYTLASLFANLAQSGNSIQNGRTEANDLRNSYLEGGNQYRLYEDSRKNIEANAGRQLRDVNKALADNQDFWNRTGNIIAGALGGSVQGYGAGSTIGTALDNGLSPEFKTKMSESWNTAATNIWDNLGSAFSRKVNQFDYNSIKWGL